MHIYRITTVGLEIAVIHADTFREAVAMAIEAGYKPAKVIQLD